MNKNVGERLAQLLGSKSLVSMPASTKGQRPTASNTTWEPGSASATRRGYRGDRMATPLPVFQ